MRRTVCFAIVVAVVSIPTFSRAEVPTYGIDVVATYAISTTLRGASESGHMVGDQVVEGQVRAFIARAGHGIDLLPLPPGYSSSIAFDVNSAGVVVGTVADNGFPYDLGEPATWSPDGMGGYTVSIPQQFATLPSPLGSLSIFGGQIVAVNEAGVLIGWSRFQGFQGGPPTRFFAAGPPVDLRQLGFDATPRDISDTDLVIGDQKVLDLAQGTVIDLE